MAPTVDDAELEILSQIRALNEGDMKDKLLEAFLSQVHSTKKESSSKPRFIDTSFDRNTRAFQRSQLQDKVHQLTLAEVSREIHTLKSEISTLKEKVSSLEKGKFHEEEEEIYFEPKNTNVQIFQGKKDKDTIFREMRLLTIQYQHHHVLLNICIQGQMFSLKTLIDSGADINVLNEKIITSKYWIKA